MLIGQKINFYTDTGALYRAIAVGLLDRGKTGDSPAEEIESLLPELSVSIETSGEGEQQVYLNRLLSGQNQQ